MCQPICVKGSVLFAVLLLASPHAAEAQTASAPTPVSLKLPPGITMSGGMGVMTRDTADSQTVPVLGGSMEIALNRFMLAQAEVSSSRWDNHSTQSGYSFTQTGFSGPFAGSFTGYSGDFVSSEHRRQTDLVGNFLGRAGAGRVHAVFGAGFGLGITHYDDTTTTVGCISTPLSPCSTSPFRSSGSYTDFVQQFVAGVDVRLTQRLTAFGTFRARTMPDQEMVAIAGLRATVRRAPVGVPFSSGGGTRHPSLAGAPTLVTLAAAIGKEVHVVAPDHSRQTGQLVSADDTKVVISGRDGQVSILRTDVQGVRLTSHVFRNATLIGLGAGFGTGLVWGGSIEEDGGNYALAGGLMFGGIGAGVGAAIGAVANLSSAGRRTVDIGPGKAALNLAPVIGKGRIGFTGLFSW